MVAGSLVAVSPAHAHFIWAVVSPDNRQVRIEVAETPGDSVVPMLGARIPQFEKTLIGELKDEPDHLHLTAP
jgi:hypothetical protein